MKTVSPTQADKSSKKLKKIAVKEGVVAAKENLRTAKEEAVAAKRTLKFTKGLAAAIDVEATAQAIKEAKNNLKIAKLALACAKNPENANADKNAAAIRKAKKNLKDAKQALKQAKKPVPAVNPEESAAAVKAAKKRLEIAKQDVNVAKLNVQRAKHPGEILKDGIVKRFWKTKFLFLLFLPALIYYIVFKYVPMWGVTISFYDYRLLRGLAGSEFIGFRNFEAFFRNPDFWMMTWNTLALSFQGLFISFPLTILFALMLNELRSQKFKKVTQTVSYMPHFLSTVIICALVRTLCDPEAGAINSIIKALGGDPIYFLIEPSWFRPIYLISDIWAGIGWATIVYLAAISSVDPGLYEAARLDGAGRWRQMWSITLPAIAPTVATMFILKVGHVMDGSLEKVLLLGHSATREVSNILATYSFNLAFNSTNGQAMSTAVGLYTSLVNLVMLMFANWVSKKVTETSVF